MTNIEPGYEEALLQAAAQMQPMLDEVRRQYAEFGEYQALANFALALSKMNPDTVQGMALLAVRRLLKENPPPRRDSESQVR